MPNYAQVYRLNHPTKLTLRAAATLVIDEPRRFLVDCGHFTSVADIDAALRMTVGFGMEAITDVYFTHLHFDHYKDFAFGTQIQRIYFPTREFHYIRELMQYRADLVQYTAFLRDTHERIAPVFLREFIRLADAERYNFDNPHLLSRLALCHGGQQLSPSVGTVDLEGHCPGQVGLRIGTARGVCIIAGDAVLSLDDFLATNVDHHLIVFNEARLLASRRRVGDADYVVPGHGGWFDPRRRSLIDFDCNRSSANA